MRRIHTIKLFLLLSIISMTSTQMSTAQERVDDTDAALAYLRQQQEQAKADLLKLQENQYLLLDRMLDMGLWEEVLVFIEKNRHLTAVEKQVLTAKYWWFNNEFKRAAHELSKLRPNDQQAPLAIRMKAVLLIESWQLELAEQLCNELLQKTPRDEATQIILGRTLLLQKKYDEALALAQGMLAANPNSAAAYLLESDVYFWNQKPDLAVAPIRKSLALNPLNADARFSYGYAIWRRVDATQLHQMAAQWNVALAINPLHFQTHWHWGNGHTNLTYADYADQDERTIREKLKPADNFVRNNAINAAINITRDVQAEFGNSVLPLMHRASIYYSDFDATNRNEQLDTAAALFLEILDRKPHYGPAHNGLAAVIKSKRIPYLHGYDSITRLIETNPITDWDNFSKVFPDVTYYPGDMAKGMVWNQLYTAVVYFPFLTKQQNTFVIPPLHEDLAIAMKAPYFRFNTTFDNRQWMDIRGVGSGAAGIEYVERGAYEERNVLLHEYVHLFHGRVLTDAQNRQIRKLYYNAMEHGLTLDYYSQNNESEYLAQTYPAYFEHVKVHPLDFKSMNTESELKQKDPEMYRFLDELISHERAYLAGDEQAMASNWAQVYVNLSNRAQRNDIPLAQHYLDTALQYDSSYLPAYLAYAKLKQIGQYFAGAQAFIDKAKQLDSTYAPIYVTQAELIEASAEHDVLAVQQQAELYNKTLALEDDFQLKAQVAIQLRQLYHRNGMIADAIQAATHYATTGAAVSTYLRDRRDEARAYAATQKALLGDTTQLPELQRLVSLRPQHYTLRGMYADALMANHRHDDAIATIKEVQRILEAAGNSRADFELRLAENFEKTKQTDSLNRYMATLLEGDPERLDADHNQRLVRLLVRVGKTDEAKRLFERINAQKNNHYMASMLLSDALIQLSTGNKETAQSLLVSAISSNPYQLEAYHILQAVYGQDSDEALELNSQLEQLRSQISRL